MASWTPVHEYDPVLHQAAFIGDLDKLKSLLVEEEQRGLINVKNRLGCTPIRLSATAGHKNCVDYLINQGADIEVTDIKGQTPLHVAVKNHHTGCIQSLLQAGASPEGDGKNISTPLYMAAMDGYTDAIKLLISHGANVNSRIVMRPLASTALYISLVYNHFDCFKMLLQAGADPDLCCKGKQQEEYSNQSLYHTAVRQNCDEKYLLMLYEFGASLYTKDHKGQLAVDLEVHPNCSASRDLVRALMKTPRSLKSHCRLVIRRVIGGKGHSLWNQLQQLSLPNKILMYLNYDDIS
ncbi:ankyrin repeat and SOCS box protein 1 [Lingula anatina]|uniref:Ankyrin repeat and SOCS box protein 1 n=1 Tax=Lingula anatina TaxID=7574 RepID=A0A1S3JRK6_LINAN|nr:ankyrin repeat and SOCS box protein 1 [Lingula anatina]|eukprot:XP_013392560.1 ankyrin repeat and SOCS box protein 1 [Lingula anatina]